MFMAKLIATPVVSLSITGPDLTEAVTVEVGSTVTATVSTPGGGAPTSVSGTVVGISLRRREQTTISPNTRIYDGVPTNHYYTDDLAGLHNASIYFEGEAIGIKLEDDTVQVIPVWTISEITVAAADSDGSSEGTDPKEPSVNPGG